MQTPLWSYVGGIARGLESTPLEIGGTADHLHALVTLPGPSLLLT